MSKEIKNAIKIAICIGKKLFLPDLTLIFYFIWINLMHFGWFRMQIPSFMKSHETFKFQKSLLIFISQISLMHVYINK